MTNETQTYYIDPDTGMYTSVAVMEIKTRRNRLLYESDWTQLPNGPLSFELQTAWAAYRQHLRDIPTQSGFPTDVVWPERP
jgi:hypothetical protein